MSTKWQYAIEQTLIASKIIVYTTGSLSLLTITGYSATQIYLERKEPTPGEWSFASRILLRTSRLSERWTADDRNALTYSRAALERSGSTNGFGFAEAKARMARAELRLGHIESAKEYFSEALRAEEEGDYNKNFSPSRVSDSCRRLGTIYEELGEQEQALRLLWRAVDLLKPSTMKEALIPEDEHPSPQLLDACTSLALCLAKQNDLPHSLAIFLTVLRARKQPGARFGAGNVCQLALVEAYLGEVYWGLNNAEQATEWTQSAFNRASSVKSSSCVQCSRLAGNNLAIMFEKRGDVGQAALWRTRAVGLPAG